ncbi:cytochrome c oxidase subunit 3 [Haloarcula nitratireducens]|uniref:Heme-copper oxidase subunit III n=1 Tax=Haloarcula nitratireducens TaxID=2487749 RepID=A0AAW4PFX6_9EURY|nr:heme-copper oxidase subunit III [Halomicroarcula nitratireducens]MBX0296729.1 heme-copper oxidase subunit III [Halomicroarcula nitratireducens]
MGTVDDGANDQEYHLPVGEDWPRGFSESSWWPLVTGVGVAGLYTATACYVMSLGEGAFVPDIIAPVLTVISVFTFLAGLYGWLYDGFVSTFWTVTPAESDSRALRFAMLLFLGTDIATFGAGFLYYFFIRVGTWPPDPLPAMISPVVVGNTLALLASSITFHIAHRGLIDGNRQRFLRFLGMTLLLGIVFVVGQLYEYYQFVTREGFTATSGLFASAFYGLTGLHGLHVALGVILLGIVFARALLGQYSDRRNTSVMTAGMYWHFVDAMWVLIVVTVYVSATTLPTS